MSRSETLSGRRTRLLNRFYARLSRKQKAATGFVSQPEPRTIGSFARGRQLIAGNLLFAAPSRNLPQLDMASEHRFARMLKEQGLTEDMIAISQAVIETLTRTFGHDGTDHPLFRRLGLEDETYLRLSTIARKRQEQGDTALSEDEKALMLIVPLTLTAEQIGPSFPEQFKEKILAIRKSRAAELRSYVGGRFTAMAPETYLERLTVVENAIYGRVSMMAGARSDEIEDVVAELFADHGLRRRIAAII